MTVRWFVSGSNLLLRCLAIGEVNVVGIVVVRMNLTATADALGFDNRVAISTTGNCLGKPSTSVPVVVPAATADRVDQQR